MGAITGAPHSTLLSGEVQVAAQQLPVRNLLVFEDLKRAILQQFVMAQQLRDSCDVEVIIDQVVLEQFVTRLPRKTAEWVQCHHLTLLDSAIQQDHMVACPSVDETLPLFFSLYLFPSTCPFS